MSKLELNVLLYEPNTLHKDSMEVTDEEKILYLADIIPEYTIKVGNKVSYEYDRIVAVRVYINI